MTESNKAQLRNLYKVKRREISSEDLLTKSKEIALQVARLDLSAANTCHVFMTIERLREVYTQPIVDLLQAANKRVVVSRIVPQSNRMQHFLLSPDTRFKCNSYHIPEPVSGTEIQAEEIDLVFVPLLAYDLQGNRLGYGKGYYDLFLSACRPDTLKVGLSVFEPEQRLIDTNSFDVPLDCCITPSCIHTFGHNER